MARIRQIQKSKIDFYNVLHLSQEATMSRLNCHNIGRIIEFDKTTQTCTIELMQLKQFADEIVIPAPLTEVPLIIYGCGDATITLPNPVGATCLVLFLDRNMDAFMQTGEQYVPDTARMHDFTDCVAITTFRTLANPIEDYDDTSISINYQALVNEVLYYSTIKNFGSSINLKVINTDEENPNTSEINIADKIKVQNTAQSLASLIDALLTACEGIATVNGGNLTPNSKQAFTDLKTQFGELLE